MFNICTIAQRDFARTRERNGIKLNVKRQRVLWWKKIKWKFMKREMSKMCDNLWTFRFIRFLNWDDGTSFNDCMCNLSQIMTTVTTNLKIFICNFHIDTCFRIAFLLYCFPPLCVSDMYEFFLYKSSQYKVQDKCQIFDK